METKTIAWFSAGVSSAVATKLAIDQIDQIIYTHIDDQHLDTLRFVRECEEWFGKKVEIKQSPYKKVSDVLRAVRFLNSPGGAPCTNILKRRLRKEWEAENQFFNWFNYVWGMDSNEAHRCEELRESMPQVEHIFPLIERGLTKEEAHKILKASGIKRPAMYNLGYQNNNCIGCVKGGMGYWNHIRVDFPEVFKERAELEREIGATFIHTEKEGRVYLDELDPERGRFDPPVVEECGIMCEMLAI